MTTPNHPTGQQPTAWHTYLTTTHAARDHYLNITHQAHLMLLTGPFPDREAYQWVENTAWNSYYTAARAAWEHYTRTLTCPCCTARPYTVNDCTCRDDCGAYWCQAKDADSDATPTRDAGHNPDEFDQRQETYPAADPNRRDNQ